VNPADLGAPSLFLGELVTLSGATRLGAGGLITESNFSNPDPSDAKTESTFYNTQNGSGAGWEAVQYDGGGSVTGKSGIQAENGLIVIRYAAFDAYTVSLNVNGGSAISPSSYLVAPTESLELPNATRTGSFEFLGWWSAASGGVLLGMGGGRLIYAR
jgi:hypothetical protein